jgi:hypothetical protein
MPGKFGIGTVCQRAAVLGESLLRRDPGGDNIVCPGRAAGGYNESGWAACIREAVSVSAMRRMVKQFIDRRGGTPSPSGVDLPPPWWLPPALVDSRGRLRVTLAGLLSVVLHLVALIVLARLTVSGYTREVFQEIQALMREEPPLAQAELPADLQIAEPDEQQRQSLLAAEASSLAELAVEEPRVDPVVLPADVELPQIDISQPRAVGLELDDVVVQKGRAGEEVTTVEGAVDRLTHEIVSNLEHGKLLVVWLMDASISLVDDREAIAKRLERVYSELDQLGSLQGDLLLNAVVSFGMDVNFLLPPSNDVQQVSRAIREVPIDDSGVENVFSAVLATLERYKSLRGRQDRRILLVVWTDESGDDYARLEEAIKLCQRLTVPVFTVGPSSMFGRQKGTHAYQNPEDGKVYSIEVDRGPDSARYELLRLPYWFSGPQYERLHAGIGPFALTRMAVETGGAYFISEDKSDKSPFSLDAMRRYLPEYTSAGDYQRQAQKSRLRQAILRAVDLTLSREMKGTPRLEFEPTGENFQDQLREAQQSVAFNSIILNEALAGFGAKGLEEDYEKEPSPRWRAWYDLTYGRLLAMQVRCNEYNWACAEMKGKGADFVDKQSNRWTFKPSDKVKLGPAAERQVAEARRLLLRCVKENPGTPWEALAQRELAFPFGFEIEERYVPRPEERMMAGPNVMPRGRRVEQLRQLPRPQMPVLPKL